jgi:hypothetical protein
MKLFALGLSFCICSAHDMQTSKAVTQVSLSESSPNISHVNGNVTINYTVSSCVAADYSFRSSSYISPSLPADDILGVISGSANVYMSSKLSVGGLTFSSVNTGNLSTTLASPLPNFSGDAGVIAAPPALPTDGIIGLISSSTGAYHIPSSTFLVGGATVDFSPVSGNFISPFGSPAWMPKIGGDTGVIAPSPADGGPLGVINISTSPYTPSALSVGGVMGLPEWMPKITGNTGDITPSLTSPSGILAMISSSTNAYASSTISVEGASGPADFGMASANIISALRSSEFISKISGNASLIMPSPSLKSDDGGGILGMTDVPTTALEWGRYLTTHDHGLVHLIGSVPGSSEQVPAGLPRPQNGSVSGVFTGTDYSSLFETISNLTAEGQVITGWTLTYRAASGR